MFDKSEDFEVGRKGTDIRYNSQQIIPEAVVKFLLEKNTYRFGLGCQQDRNKCIEALSVNLKYIMILKILRKTDCFIPF